MDPHARALSQQNVNYKLGRMHEGEWKPASGSKTLANAAFNYIEQRPPTPKKIVKDENGRVAIEMRNIQTNSCTNIESTLLKRPKYLSDPYSRKTDIEREFNQKMMQKRGEESFVAVSCGGKIFNKDSSIYGTNAKFPQKRNDNTKHNIFRHESAFKPANVSHGPFNKFTEYKPQSPQLKMSGKS